MGKAFRWGCLGVAAMLVALTVIGFVVPQPKCGEVGYHEKLTPLCQAAQGHADTDRYCSPDELADIKCAAATRADENRRWEVKFRKVFSTRT